MKLSAIKSELASMDELSFNLPAHFHVTEVGQVSKRYIDCGGTSAKSQRSTSSYGKMGM